MKIRMDLHGVVIDMRTKRVIASWEYMIGAMEIEYDPDAQTAKYLTKTEDNVHMEPRAENARAVLR